MVILLLLSCLSSYAQSESYLTLLTELRQAHQLSQPTPHPLLDQSAQAFAQELAQRGQLSHRDRLQLGPEHRASRLGLGVAGEVLGYGWDPRLVFQAWLESPGHRRVLLNEAWQYVGLGLAPWGQGHIVVMVFWAPP